MNFATLLFWILDEIDHICSMTSKTSKIHWTNKKELCHWISSNRGELERADKLRKSLLIVPQKSFGEIKQRLGAYMQRKQTSNFWQGATAVVVALILPWHVPAPPVPQKEKLIRNGSKCMCGHEKPDICPLFALFYHALGCQCRGSPHV